MPQGKIKKLIAGHDLGKLDDDARTWLAENGFDQAYGARPMARVIQEHIKRPLAEQCEAVGDIASGPAEFLLKAVHKEANVQDVDLLGENVHQPEQHDHQVSHRQDRRDPRHHRVDRVEGELELDCGASAGSTNRFDKLSSPPIRSMIFAATSATYGMPLVVELGVALDILIAAFIFGLFFFQIRTTFDSLDLKEMEKLKEGD